MDKSKIVTAFIQKLELALQASKEAALATYQAATHEESKPENEYDTRGLEASYLAGAQAKRAGEIEEVLLMFKTLKFQQLSEDQEIRSTALVEIETQGKKSLVLVLPRGGGETLEYEGRTIQIITPHSVLGEALIGLGKGDTAEIEVGGKMMEYQILHLS